MTRAELLVAVIAEIWGMVKLQRPDRLPLIRAS